jgi:uncharacterized protein (DUF488 family)
MFTIGHSTHPLATFVDLLVRNEIEELVDIRRFPASRKYPHFNQESLAASLAEANIGYGWMEALGGRRRKQTGQVSVNEGLRSESFRNYADYMLTREFQEAMDKLLRMAEGKRSAYMCSEALYWRCHRRLVSDVLTARGIDVQHIMPTGKLRPHELTQGAVIEFGKVTHPASGDTAPHGAAP